MLALATLLGGLACDSPGRPTVSQWQAEWNEVLAITANGEDGDEARSVARCNSFAKGARQARTSLSPTPDAVLDEAVIQWMQRAEWLGSNCPASHGDYEEQSVALRELRILEAEIHAGLQAAASSQPVGAVRAD